MRVRQRSWGFRDARRDARRRRNRRIFRVVVVLAVLVGLVWLSFDQGRKQAAMRIAELEKNVAQLEQTTASARETATNARAEIATLKSEAATWKERYNAEVPQGQNAVLWQLVTRRLDEGVKPDRLAEVIQLATNKRKCDAQTTTKRIIVKTSMQGGQDTSASFANHRITVSGEGHDAHDANNNPLAWYDPSQRVKISFTEIGGKTEVVEGFLPLNHTTLINKNEYRFQVTEGPRSFALVTVERCNYP